MEKGTRQKKLSQWTAAESGYISRFSGKQTERKQKTYLPERFWEEDSEMLVGTEGGHDIDEELC